MTRSDLGCLLAGLVVACGVANCFTPVAEAFRVAKIENGRLVETDPVGNGPFCRWNLNTLPDRRIAYYINNRGSDDLELADVNTVLVEAFGKWKQVAGTSIDFQPLGTSSISVFDSYDGKNNIFWDEEGDIFPGEGELGAALALTITRMDLTTGEILDGDIAFNGYKINNCAPFIKSKVIWSSNKEKCKFTGRKVLAKLNKHATHEIGHLLGLQHSFLTNALMYPVPRVEQLSQDDIDGAKFLYSANNTSRADLRINFNVNPVPQSSGSCDGVRPAWNYRGTLAETAGVGFRVNSFIIEYYGSDGAQLNIQTLPASEFLRLFDSCGTGTSRISPNSQVCADLCTHLGGANSGSLIFKFLGTDDNGNDLSFQSGRLGLSASGPRANLQFITSPNPVPQNRVTPCQGTLPAWYFTWTLSETNGIGITLIRRTGDFYDGNGNYIDTVTYFDGIPRVDALSQVPVDFCAHLWGRNAGSVIDTFYGVDDNGNSLSFRTPVVTLRGSAAVNASSSVR